MRNSWTGIFAALAYTCLWLMPAARADGLGYSYTELSGFHVHADTGGGGHGGRLALSYALSGNAFMYTGAAQSGFDTTRSRRYDFGIGINTSADTGYSLFAALGWNHVGNDNAAAPGVQDHGFGASLGIRALLSDRWEIYALASTAHNDALAQRSRGEYGALYAVSKAVSLGAAVAANPGQSEYLLSLRVYY
ncbi:MAG: hypothetical protein KGJ56_01685 [Gammaproteobacteria bacterium]|nr:hypothetical protein [Gammaproteobacteria bacterium]